MTIREMTIEDYDQVYALWMKIKGFGIRSIDDSREGIERFLRRNPTTSVVAEKDGKIVGGILCVTMDGADVSIMSAWIRSTEDMASAKAWSYLPWKR